MGTCSSAMSDEDMHQAVQAIVDWQNAQHGAERARQAMRVVRNDSFKASAVELDSPLVEQSGGPDIVLRIVQTFYLKLFACEKTKHFWAYLTPDRMRNLQLSFMRYMFGGPAKCARNMRSSHVRLVKEQGLDNATFDHVVGILVETLKELNAPKEVIANLAVNAEHARHEIFTPNPDEYVSHPDMLKAVTEANSPIVRLMGGAETAAKIITTFYHRMFSSGDLKMFFTALQDDRARNMQFRFMRYVLVGPGTYEGDMRCVHARMVEEQGLDMHAFNRVADMLMHAMHEEGISKVAVQMVHDNIEHARCAIFGPNAAHEAHAHALHHGLSHHTSLASAHHFSDAHSQDHLVKSLSHHPLHGSAHVTHEDMHASAKVHAPVTPAPGSPRPQSPHDPPAPTPPRPPSAPTAPSPTPSGKCPFASPFKPGVEASEAPQAATADHAPVP